MGRISHNITIRLGSDVHRMVKNERDECYCLKCSLRSLCFEIGVSSRENLCDAMLIEVYDNYRREFSPHGGHFVLNQEQVEKDAKKKHSASSTASGKA